jgi:hypothetical protein
MFKFCLDMLQAGDKFWFVNSSGQIYGRTKGWNILMKTPFVYTSKQTTHVTHKMPQQIKCSLA